MLWNSCNTISKYSYYLGSYLVWSKICLHLGWNPRVLLPLFCCWTRKWGERLPSWGFGIDHLCNRQTRMYVEDLPALSYKCVRATSSPRWMSRISRPGIAEPLLCKGSYPQQGEMIYGRITSLPYLFKRHW